MEEKKSKVILDVDTGSDDAIAIMLALKSKHLDVLGITTVNGNQPLPNTTENTLRIVDLLKSDVPVYRGCAEPLVGSLLASRQCLEKQAAAKKEVDGEIIAYHSEYLNFPPSTSKIQDISAVQYLVDTSTSVNICWSING